MKTSYELPFKLFGIPIKINISFLIFLPILAWLIGNQIDVYIKLLNLDINTESLTREINSYWLGLISAIGLFLGVTLHELGHSFFALRYGVKIKSITLHVLGGVAQLEEIPEAPGQEAKMAAAGPLTSFVLGGICWIILWILSPQALVLKFTVGYLVFMNFAVGVFNLIPALPLDGGRILRSLLALNRPRLEATKLSANVSKSIAVAMGLFGLINLNIFLILIAFFIYASMSSEIQSLEVSKALEEVKIKDLMTRDVVTVSPGTNVSELIKTMLNKRHLGYPVIDRDKNVVGIVTLEDLQKSEGDREIVANIMTRPVITIKEDQDAMEAFKKISHNNLGRLIVVNEDGKMVGIISRTDIMNALKIRTLGKVRTEVTKIGS